MAPYRQLAEAAPGKLAAAPDPDSPRHSVALELDRIGIQGGRFVALTSDGGRAELTLEPRLQRLAADRLAVRRVAYGAAVLLSVDDGRILALAGHSTAEPEKSPAELCLTPWAPAASVFKIVTAAALVSEGIAPTTRVCYHAGVHSVEADNLSDHPRLDRACGSLAFGLAKSQNAILARLAHDHLDRQRLGDVAHRLGFGEELPFEVAAPRPAPSRIDLPTDGLAFARVAAGFYQTWLSPLHGAHLAATIGLGGVAPSLRVVDRIVRGGEVLLPAPLPARRVLDESTARAVGRMMIGTTQFGTARLGFHDRAGRPLLPGIMVAGKTGTLNRKERPMLGYSWFVGYAPAEKPSVAVAVLLGNQLGHDQRAHRVAAELLEGYFNSSPTLLAKR